MPTLEAFAYTGKRALIVGGATGMGAATASAAAALGAEIVVMDVADINYPANQTIKVDLRDKASVDAALDQIKKPLDVLFLCAGVADGTKGLMLINFISQRHIVQQLLAKRLLNQGAAVVMISSVAGLSWQKQLGSTQAFLACTDWESATAWLSAHEGTDSYAFSKMVMNTYIAQEALPLIKMGIRINAILPGPTDTPLARANADQWLGFGAGYRAEAGLQTLKPQQMANVMVFLGSQAASGISGITLLVDQGHISAGITGAYEDGLVKMVMGMG